VAELLTSLALITPAEEPGTSVLNSPAELAAMTVVDPVPLSHLPRKATKQCTHLNEVSGLFLLTPVLVPRLDE